MARYKEKYRKLRRLTQKVRDWANAADKEFFELMADDGKLPKATQRAQDVAKFVPYHASKVSKEMLNLVNDRRLEIKEQAAEDRVALKEQAAADKLEQQEMAVTDMPEQEMAVVDTLYNIANSLDKKGLHKEADIVTETMVAIAAGEETGFYGHDYDDSKQSEPAVDEYGYKNDPSLSVGTCPDHRGTRLIPVDDRIYQCPIDGKIYNWAEGFTALDGTKYRGGDVAAQTPDSPSWTAAPPARWFEGQGR